MMKAKKLLLVCLFSVATVGAQNSAQTAPVLFIREYANYAWGHQDNGWFIDSTGALLTFDLQKDSVWTLSASDSLTPQQMQLMHGFATASNRRISQDTLMQMAALIQPSRSGTISFFDNGCRDFGGVDYRAYYYDNAAMLYRTVYLFGFGDGGIRNSSSAAITLARWLVYTVDGLSDNSSCMASIVAPSWVPDFLEVRPAHPSSTDSIRLTITITTVSSCYHVFDAFHDSTAVFKLGDTALLLKYQYLQGSCDTVPILSVNAQFAYRSEPLKAGTYSVYELVHTYAFSIGQEVPVGDFQRKIGEFTVSAVAAVSPQNRSLGSTSIVKLDRQSRIYDIRGRLIPAAESAGLRLTPGVYYIRSGDRWMRMMVPSSSGHAGGYAP